MARYSARLGACLLLALAASDAMAQEQMVVVLSQGRFADLRFAAPLKTVKVMEGDAAEIIPLTDRKLRIVGVRTGEMQLRLSGQSGRLVATVSITVEDADTDHQVSIERRSSGMKTVTPP